MKRWTVRAVATGAILWSAPASAGGLEYPDNGAEAMGRGAAFTAKADDGSALFYNVAGFAGQRGTRLTVGANVAIQTATFQRSGAYPDPASDPLTPWAGEPFPLVENTGLPFPVPHLVVSTDFGAERFTLAAGVYAPSVVGGRVFPLGVGGKPSPARYDTIESRGIIVYPSLAAAYRITDWLDLGAAANLVVGRIDATTVTSADLAKAICPNQEYQPCDTRLSFETTGNALALTVGALLRPTSWLQIGGQVRTPHTLATEGTVRATAPAVQPTPIAPGQAFLTQRFPWVVRTGLRVIGMQEKFERWDAEVDVVYEAWGSALGDGIAIGIPKLSIFEDVRSTLRLGFHDTMSFRGGGAYNLPVADGVGSLRAGGYHETSATNPEDTRLVFDALAKTGVTLGAGWKRGPIGLNLAVAQIFHGSRDVTNGRIRPINGSQGGQSIDSAGEPYGAVNDGKYRASTFVLSLGVVVQLDELFGTKRDARDVRPRLHERERASSPHDSSARVN